MFYKFFCKCIYDVEWYKILAQHHGRFSFTALHLPLNLILEIILAVLAGNLITQFLVM